MKTKLVIADQEFLLDDTDQNQEIVRKIQEVPIPALLIWTQPLGLFRRIYRKLCRLYLLQ